MAYFDMDIEYNDSIPLTLAALCREVAAEDGGDRIICDGAYREYFRNGYNSGLIQKLRTNLGYDIDQYLSGDCESKHDALKLLKLLYIIEKHGKPKNRIKSLEETRIRITDVLAKPRLGNIKTELPHQSIYGEIIEKLQLQVQNSITDADNRKKTIEVFYAYWENAHRRLLNQVFSDAAMRDKDSAKKRIEQILRRIRMIGEEIHDDYAQICAYDDGVFESFFDLLECHRYKCIDATLLHNLEQAQPLCQPSAEIIAIMDQLEKRDYSWDVIDRIERFLDESNDDIEVMNNIIILWPLIFDGQRFEDHEHEDWLRFRFAASHARSVIPWLKSVKGDVVHYEEMRAMPVDLFICIIQEIICVSREKVRLKNDCWGYNNVHQSLRSALKEPEDADPMMVTLWVQRLENRVATAHGGYELICILREIEKVFFRIKQYAFSYYDIRDFSRVNSSLLRDIEDALPSSP